MTRDPQAGAGSVLVIGLVAVLVTVAGLLGVLARSQHAVLAARSAADLAALAGAAQVVVPEHLQVADGLVEGRAGPACLIAQESARRNRATLVTCEVRAVPGGGVVEVRLVRAGVEARSRAGPSSAR